MKKIILIFLILFINQLAFGQLESDSFTKSFNTFSEYDSNTKEWSKESSCYVTFIINYNSHKDIKYISGEKVHILTRISELTEGTTPEGFHYQTIRVIDEMNAMFDFQYFDYGAIKFIFLGGDKFLISLFQNK